MNSVWYSLLWKEFREHLWKAVSLTAVLVAVPIWTMFDEPSGVYFAATLALTMYTPFAAVYLAMGIAAGERSTGTVAFAGALPLQMWKLAAAKLLTAFAALTAPVVILLLIVGFWQLNLPLFGVTGSDMTIRDVGPFQELAGDGLWYLVLMVAATLGGGSLLVSAAALGCNFVDEVRAGAVALGGIAVWWMATLSAFWIIGDLKPHGAPLGWKETVQMMFYVPPGSPAGYPGLLLDVIRSPRVPASFDRLVFAMVTLSLLVHSALVGSFLRRFGRTLPAARPLMKARSTLASTTLLPPPRRSPLRAIVWKQFRETGPLALIALVSIVVIGCCVVIPVGVVTRQNIVDFAKALSKVVVLTSVIVGAFVVTATGIGLFVFDLQPRLHAFWRSRPIDPNLWYWTKLITGLVLVLTAVYLPLILGLYVGRLGPQYSGDIGIEFPYHVFGFTTAALAICLLRQPIYAAIIAVGVSLGAIALITEKVSSDTWQYACYAALIVLSTLIAWAAVRWNIGVGRSRAR